MRSTSVRLGFSRQYAVLRAVVSELMQPNQDQDAFLQQAEAAIEARFPLLKTVCLASGPGQVLVPAPFFVAMIAAILESADKPCCVARPIGQRACFVPGGFRRDGAGD